MIRPYHYFWQHIHVGGEFWRELWMERPRRQCPSSSLLVNTCQAKQIGRGVSRTLLKERGSFQHVLLPWRPGHEGSSRFLFPLPGLLPTFTSHCPCGHHAIGTQVHSTVAFPEQPLLIHGREGVTTQLPKHKQMRSKISTCFNRKEGGEGLWVRDVHGNTTKVGMWGRAVVAWPFSGGGVEDGTF